MDEHISRRVFLAGTLSVAAVAVAPVVLASPAAATASSVAGRSQASYWRRSTYSPLVGDTFHLTGSEDAIPLVLSQISDLQPTATPGAENQFSLLFTAPGRQVRAQGVYNLQHSDLGTVGLLIVPVDRGLSMRQYQVIVNQ